MAAPNPVAAPAQTNPLAPLSAAQITKQATNTISKAYAPSYTDINSQAARAQGISAKRTADNRTYSAWLATQMATLQSHAQAANQQLLDAQNQLTASQQSLYSQQPGSAIAAANARAGNVSNNAQSNSFNQDLVQNEQENVGRLGGAVQKSNSDAMANNNMLGAAAENNYGIVAAGQNKQLSDLSTTLGKLQDERTKLRSTQTSDTAKEIARLQGVEVQKAQSNRDFQIAAQKLGISAAETNSLIANRAAQTGIAQQNANTNALNAQTRLTSLQQSQANSDRTYNLDKQKYGQSVAKDLYERQHGLGPYRVAAGKGAAAAKPPLTQASQNTIYSHILSISAELQTLIDTYGQSPQSAYHALQTGSMNYRGKTQTLPTGIKTVGDPVLLNAGYNSRQGGLGLNAGDIAALKALGLTDPASRLGGNISPGGAASPH